MANLITTIVSGLGYVPGVPGTFSNCIVVSDQAGNIISVNGLPVPSPQPGDVALSAPASTTANTDTLCTFATQVNGLKIQNTSPYNVYVAYDHPAVAGGGSFLIPPGGVLFDSIPVTVVHLLCSAIVSINSGTSGIFIEGQL